MAKAARAGGATPLRAGLPEEIIVWEILVRLPPKSLLRCRSVCRIWQRATSTRGFLLAHHGRQPSLPIVSSYESGCKNIHVFNHRAAGAQLQPVVRFDDSTLLASCDGLLVLSKHGRTSFSVCNPATRQHAPLQQLSGFTLLAMYRHRPTEEYRLLLHYTLSYLVPKDQIDCYVMALGSDQSSRYVGSLEAASSAYLHTPALLRDSLHWCPLHYQSDPLQRRTGSKAVIVFDTTSESFGQMRTPVVPAKSYIFEMDTTLGIYSHDDAKGIVDIWVLQNYESEVWHHKYRVELPAAAAIKVPIGMLADSSVVSVVSVGGDVLLLVGNARSMFYVGVDGELVDNFHSDGQFFYASHFRLKQTLVPHTFFTTLEGYAVNDSLFSLTAVE